MPEDRARRATIRILTDYGVVHLFTTHRTLRDQLAKPETERQPEVVAEANKNLRKLLLRFEEEMGDSPYLAGEKISLLDTNFIARFVQWERFGVLPDASVLRLGAWLERMKKRPAFQAVFAR